MFRPTLQRLNISQSFLLFCLLVTVPLLVMGWISLMTALGKQETAIARHLVVIRQVAKLHEKDYLQHLYYTWTEGFRPSEFIATSPIERPDSEGDFWWVKTDGTLISEEFQPRYELPLPLQHELAQLMTQKVPYGNELLTNRTNQQQELVIIMATRLPKGVNPGYSGLVRVQKMDYAPLFSFYLENYPTLLYRVYTGEKTDPARLFLTNIKEPMVLESSPLYDSIAFLTGYQGSQSDQKYERINDHAYRSLQIPILNIQHRPIGLEIFTVDQEQFHPYQRLRVAGYIGFHIISLLLILIAVRSFSKTFIGPVGALSEVSKKVAEGDWTVRVEDPNAHGEMKQTLDNFNHMLGQLQDHDQLRQSFIVNLSHDFRTPLFAQERAMELVLEELREGREQSGQNPEHTAELLALMDGALKNNRHLLHMVNLLLETYQYEAGSMVVNQSPIRIHGLIQQCCEQITAIARPKGIQVETELMQNPPLILADPDSITRILLNLLGNALENIPRGSLIRIVTINSDGKLTIEIHDNGPGIPPEDLPHVFKRHYSGRHNRRKVGSGLGLYICEILAKANQGSIAVKSQVGMYTSFTLTFPIYEKTEAADGSFLGNPLE